MRAIQCAKERTFNIVNFHCKREEMNMKEVEAIVELTLKKRFLLELEDDENEEQKVIDMINEMTAEECKQFLTSGFREIVIEEFSKETVVKKAMNKFNPIYIISGEENQVAEYDGESKRIAAKIKHSMSEKEIATMIAEEFNTTHHINMKNEDFMWPAEEIHYYLNVIVQ